jgi:hypothetical protein
VIGFGCADLFTGIRHKGRGVATNQLGCAFLTVFRWQIREMALETAG